ncbi:lipase secretion chaperone [Veronia nyctiphanis]|uniref:lipase secretion chaperone n=1 Tax=Veronia nyctiphanis TaxID=1278244 RepID=UPI001375C7EA|nr:lipase secretion chaperone [Veronia nyctiphanis]
MSFFLTEDKGDDKYVAPSQQDTQVDIGSSRDLFEYFLSSTGERDLSDIKEQFDKFILEGGYPIPGQQELFEKYVNYRNAMSSMTADEEPQMSLSYFEALSKQMIELQHKHFTAEEVEQLFGEENEIRDLSLQKRRWLEDGLSADEIQQRWQDEVSQLAPHLQKAYKNADLLSNLSKTAEKEGQERFLAREALVGHEAAVRLEKLDNERAQFKQKLDDYLVKRDEILQNNSDSESQINHLRKEHFTAKDQKRIQALERIHDQKQK